MLANVDLCVSAPVGLGDRVPLSATEGVQGDQGAGRRGRLLSPPSSCPQDLPGAGLWRNKAWRCRGQGGGGARLGWGALEEVWEPRERTAVRGELAPDGLQPLGGSPRAPSSPGDTSAPTTASLAALREWGGGSKIREKQFDVSNKASLHFAKLILTPIIICCRSGRVLPTAA